MKNTIHKKQKGFTILFAVLVSTLVLALGIGIANITLKEITLSGVGRDSQFAFYGADTGIECALYWDFKGLDVFATSDTFSGTEGEYRCVGVDISDSFDIVESDTNRATTTFIISTDNICATVAIGKHDVKLGDGTLGSDGFPDLTIIDSRGYNTCDTSSNRRIERGLRVRY